MTYATSQTSTATEASPASRLVSSGNHTRVASRCWLAREVKIYIRASGRSAKRVESSLAKQTRKAYQEQVPAGINVESCGMGYSASAKLMDVSLLAMERWSLDENIDKCTATPINKVDAYKCWSSHAKNSKGPDRQVLAHIARAFSTHDRYSASP